MLIGFDLLDRQILDRDGEPVGKVDDVELDVDADGTPYVAALLVGQQALGQRIGGRLGGWIAGTARRLSPDYDRGPIRIPYDLVSELNSAVNLSVHRQLLPDPPLETWLRDHLIGRIPGAFDGS
jgi:sporulation protein YlmC with PRC-barrel domain